MKNLLFALIALFISASSYAQILWGTSTEEIKTKFKMTSGTYETLDEYVVIESEGTALELYEKTLGWINETYNTPEEVIKGKVEGEYIRITGSTSKPLKYYKGLGMILTYAMNRYSIVIRFKDGKVRFEPTEIEVYIEPNPQAFVKGGWTAGDLSARIKNQKGKELKEGTKSIEAMVSYFSNLGSSLEAYYKGGGVGADDDDW